MQRDLERLWAHLQVIYPAEGVTCSSICSSAGEKNDSQYNHVITLCHNPSKQNQKNPTKLGLAIKKNALISPVHARAG